MSRDDGASDEPWGHVDHPQPQEDVHAHDPLHEMVADVAVPRHSVLHGPPPHCTAPPWQADVPAHCVSHDAWAGQWRCMSWHAEVSPQFTAHGELSSQLMLVIWHDDTPVHCTWQNIPGGQLSVVIWHADVVEQSMVHVLPEHPPVHTVGQVVWGDMVPVGQVIEASATTHTGTAPASV